MNEQDQETIEAPPAFLTVVEKLRKFTGKGGNTVKVVETIAFGVGPDNEENREIANALCRRKNEASTIENQTFGIGKIEVVDSVELYDATIAETDRVTGLRKSIGKLSATARRNMVEAGYIPAEDVAEWEVIEAAEKAAKEAAKAEKAPKTEDKVEGEAETEEVEVESA